MGGGGKGGGKKGQKPFCYDYFMDILAGLCLGKVDRLNEIHIRDRLVLENTTNGNWTQYVSKPKLFGGDKAEGGVKGTISFLDGGPNQVVTEAIARTVGLAPSTCPGYRGIALLFFNGFKWGSNNPYIGTFHAQVTRIPPDDVLLTGNASIPRPSGEPEAKKDKDSLQWTPGPDANPAHIIVDVLLDRQSGLGLSHTELDLDSFRACANTLAAEEFGLSFFWTAQMSINNFLKEVLDHIRGLIFINPTTGLIEMRLLRKDYDPADPAIKHITPDNSKVLSFTRKAWGETVNTLTIKYTDPYRDEAASITVHDTASIAIHGNAIHEERDYHGVTRQDLATKIAMRDLRESAYPWASATVELGREFHDILPGDVVKFTSPEDGVDGIIMRVMEVDYGRVGQTPIKVKLSEDVFALDIGEWVPPPWTDWDPGGTDPTPPEHTLLMTAPLPRYFDMDTEYPSVAAWLFLNDSAPDAAGALVDSEKSTPSGGTKVVTVADLGNTPRATLGAALAKEAPETTVAASVLKNGFIGLGDIQVDDFLLIGTSETNHELVLVTAYDGSTDEYTLARGVYDTVPQDWAAGTPVWIMNEYFIGLFYDDLAAGETRSYKVRTQTSKGTLDYASASSVSHTFTERPHLPFRPANMMIGSTAWPADASVVNGDDIPVTWANRNRKLEDAVVVRWDGATVAPEEGQITKIVLYASDGSTVLATYTAAQGATGYTIPASAYGTQAAVFVELYAERTDQDGTFESMKRVRQKVNIV